MRIRNSPILAAILAAGPAAAESGNFVLIRRDQPLPHVDVAEIGPREVVYRQHGGAWTTVPREQCVALLRTDAVVAVRRHGWLRLSDGQRFPGEALSNTRPTEGKLAWNQLSWLGRLEVPLTRIESVTFRPGAEVPPPGEGDVIVFNIGDRLDAVVTSLGDPVTADLLDPDPDEPGTLEIPLDRVAAVRMVTPAREPTGHRLWLVDGTVFDVQELLLGDDGKLRIDGLAFSDEPIRRLDDNSVAAILLDAEALVPFGSLRPRRVLGPPTRYVVPAPQALDEHAALDLSRVEFRGPVEAQYVLPPRAGWFWAEARLPMVDRTWGDCELIIRDDDRQVFKTRLHAANPLVSVGVPLGGSLLTIEVTEGTAGPIQDRVILDRAMILVR